MCMTCREVKDFLVEYLTGTLPALELSEFRTHLAACPECGQFVCASRDLLRLSRYAVRNLNDPRPEDVPEALLRDIIAARTPWR